MKRILVFADSHCGSLCGLTPPAYQVSKTASRTKRGKWEKLQKELWREYLAILDELKPIDRLIYMGDGIDGSGRRSGGTELLMTDRHDQVQMCGDCITQIQVRGTKDFSVRGVYGTNYHTGDSEDFENELADKCGFESIGSHDWMETEGVTFDVKHHIGNSSIPHGRHTAIARDGLWNRLWAQEGEQPLADVVLRAHIHYFGFCGDARQMLMTVPALQGMGSKYGSRRCSGRVDWGMVHFDVEDGKVLDWQAHIVKIEAQKAKVVKL